MPSMVDQTKERCRCLCCCGCGCCRCLSCCCGCSELGLKRFTVLDNRPTLTDMLTKFRRTKLVACVGSTALTLAMMDDDSEDEA